MLRSVVTPSFLKLAGGMTGAETTRRDLLQRRNFFGTTGCGKGAAGVETASGGRIQRGGHVAVQDDPVAAFRDVDLGDAGEEREGVRMERAGADVVGRSDLHDAS